MKLALPWLIAVLPLSGFLAGCQVPKHSATSASRSTRNNGYSLLHQLLAEEKDVNKLHFLKHEESDVKALVKKIAVASAAGAKQLELFAKQDTSLVLEETRLPKGETGTRDAISSTKTWELLSETGDEFELHLLLSQAEALTYGWHLAKVTATHEPDAQRARYLVSLGEELKGLDHELVALMLSRMNPSTTTNAKTNSGP